MYTFKAVYVTIYSALNPQPQSELMAKRNCDQDDDEINDHESLNLRPLVAVLVVTFLSEEINLTTARDLRGRPYLFNNDSCSIFCSIKSPRKLDCSGVVPIQDDGEHV
jgi:hypothetical protein